MEGERPARAWVWARVLLQALLLAGLVWLGARVLCAPMPVLLDQFLPDDAFYYFQTARNFAHTGFSSFDGLHPTNGYQPLWFLICAAVYHFFPEGGDTPVRLLMGMGLVLYITGTALAFRLLREHLGALAAAVAVVFWLLVTRRLALNGLETGLSIALFFGLLHLYHRSQAADGRPMSLRMAVALGFACGLLFLARTDMAFLVAAIAATVGYRTVIRHRRGVVFAAYALPLGVLGGGYLALNLATTGHLMPVSGAAKRFHAAQRLAEAVEAGGNRIALQGENLLWPLQQVSTLWIPFGLVLSALLVVFGFRSPHPRLRIFRELGPVVLGAWLSYLFYALQFFGDFSRTPWYYAPHAFLAAVVLGVIFQLGCDVVDTATLGKPVRRLHRLCPPAFPAVLLAILCAVRIGVSTERSLRIPPGQWNYNLYLGAHWARENLPVDATLYSGSTGILGYFSGRTSVNTDGLINSHEFLEEVLRPGHLTAYQRQWDYSIDAFANTALAETYPEGHFVALPAEITRYPFPDGAQTRRLGVFKMPARDAAADH